MSIILQNYKNLILKIFKTTFINNINNYVNLISSYDDFMSHALRNSLTKSLEEIDKNYCNSSERKLNLS